MRAKKAAVVAITVILPVLLSGCASTTAPRDWLPSAGEAQQQAFGAWISVEYNDGSSKHVADGEFIAVGQDSIFVLTQDRLVAIPLSEIEGGRLATYDANHWQLAGWTALGSLTTPSHGWFLVLSLPVWILTGSAATSAQSWAPIEKLPVSYFRHFPWYDLRKFSRFPQGLPEGLDRRTMKSKPE